MRIWSATLELRFSPAKAAITRLSPGPPLPLSWRFALIVTEMTPPTIPGAPTAGMNVNCPLLQAEYWERRLTRSEPVPKTSSDSWDLESEGD